MNMNNLGDTSIHESMQAMALPVREIKTKKPYTPQIKTVTPIDFIPTKPVVKKELPAHTDVKTPAITQDDVITPVQSDTVIAPELYIPSTEIRAAKETANRNHRKRFAQIDKNRTKKEFLQSNMNNRKKTKKEMQTELFDRMLLLKSLFVVFYYIYLFHKQFNLYRLVAEYEAKPDLSQRTLHDAMDAWSKPVVVHYDFPIVSIVEENFNPKAKEKNLKALVKQYEKESRDNARKKQIAYVNTMAAEAYIKSHDAQLEQDYDCWEANRDMLNFFYNFWEQETNAYEQMFSSKTEAYNKELREAMTPTTRKKKAYKKKNPNKKKHDNFCLASGRLPERRVPKKTDYKPALRQMRAMFNNAQSNIRAYYNPEDHIR